MKFFPQLSRMESRVAISSAHFSLPFTVKAPNTKRKTTMAPTYTGPLVPGWSPQ